MKMTDKIPSAAQRRTCFRKASSCRSATEIKGTDCMDNFALSAGAMEPSHRQNFDGSEEGSLDGLGITSFVGGTSL